MNLRLLSVPLAVLAAVSVAACGTPPPPPPPPEPDASTITCQNDPRVQAYEAGLTGNSEDGELLVRIVSADPTPPARGANTWQVQLLDEAGAPLQASSIDVQPFMPDHGHGSSTPPAVAAGEDGAWSIEGIDFFMPGVWRTRISVDQGAQLEWVDFYFCVAG